MKHLLFVLIFLLANQVIGQSSEIQGKIIDASTREEIPFAKVFNQSIQKGTIGNVDGYFKIQFNKFTDTIVVTAIGYKSFQLLLNKETLFYTVKMDVNIIELSEVTITPKENSYLYDLLSDCRNQPNKLKLKAKSYFELKTFVNDLQVELVEGFFNAEIAGYELMDQELKAGRIGMKTYDENKRLFISYESSKSILLAKVRGETDYFPQSPLSFTKKKMRGAFYLQLDQKYLDDQLDSISVISYSPKQKNGEFYQGKIWVNGSTKRLLKMTMECESCKIHPFLPLFPMDSILAVNLQVTKTFAEKNNAQLFNHVDFNYSISYKSRFGKNGEKDYLIQTNALFYSYDYEHVFSIPKFEINKQASDYRKILSMPSNHFFWKYNDEYHLNDSKNTNEQFLMDTLVFTNRNFQNALNTRLKGAFFQQPYVRWSSNRVIFKNILGDSLNHNPSQASMDRNFNLSVQVFFDRNTYNDSTNHLTCTIFDPFESYYLLSIDTVTHCFINIYFDLCEIERRKLQAKLNSKQWSSKEIEQLYSEFMIGYNQLKDKYLRTVDHGKNTSELLKWNAIVLQELKIDNLSFFGLVVEK
jgi:hypothetical protein